MCVYIFAPSGASHRHVEEPTRERKKIVKNEHREFVRVIKCSHTPTTGTHD